MESEIKRKNFSEICRLCLGYASADSLLPLFSNDDTLRRYGRLVEQFKETIPEIISACIGIEIDPNDKLPSGICSSCEKQLILSNSFRRKCIVSNNYLLELRFKTETDQFYDSDDGAPFESLKHPELIIVDGIKDETNDESDDNLGDSDPCNLLWNDVKDESDNEQRTSSTRSSQDLAEESKNVNFIKQSTAKTSITVPLITPTTPIVTMTSNEFSNDNKGSSKKDLQKESKKRNNSKKTKMCTICGMMVKRLRDHMKSHPDALEYSCSHCSKRYLTKKGLIQHIDLQHTEDSSFENKHNGDNRYSNKELWQCNVRKRYREMGQAYIGIDGSVKIARTLKKSCSASCYLRCQSNFNDAKRLEIHKSFWQLSDHEKDQYYANHVERVSSVRKRTLAEHSRRLFSFIYFFNDSETNHRTQVCQKFFVNTLDISKGRIYYYFQNIHNYNTGTPNGMRNLKKRKNSISTQ